MNAESILIFISGWFVGGMVTSFRRAYIARRRQKVIMDGLSAIEKNLRAAAKVAEEKGLAQPTVDDVFQRPARRR